MSTIDHRPHSDSTTSQTTTGALRALAAVADDGPPLLSTIETACDAIETTERLQRLAAVAMVDVMQAVEDSRTYVDQGHASARVMVAHVAGISGSRAWRLDRIRRMINGDAELVAKQWRAGELGVDQAIILAKVHSNARIQHRFLTDQPWFLDQAAKLSFARFEKRIARWIELADDDGAKPAPDPSHERRNATLTQDHFSKAWHLQASLGSVSGSRCNEVFLAYVQAEYEADLRTARELHGDAATADQLPRTAAQRRADALCQMAEDAAANANPSVRVKRVHNLVWNGETAEALFLRWSGVSAPPLDPDRYGVADLDGNIVHAPSTFADLLTSTFRRVVQNAASVTVDLSRESRLFTGLARLGVELQTDECFWPGCHQPTTRCQMDHTKPAARGGRSEQCNGGPACVRHNLVKEAGYTVTRLPDGSMHIVTPSGDIVR